MGLVLGWFISGEREFVGERLGRCFVQRDLHVIDVEILVVPQHQLSNLTLTHNWSVPTGVLYVCQF